MCPESWLLAFAWSQQCSANMRRPHLMLVAMLLLATAAANDILKAIDKNNLAQLNMALKSTHPKKVNEADAEGATPLMVAVTGGKHKVIKALLKSGADTATKNAAGLSVMHAAAEKGHERVIQVLITHGLDANEVHAEDGLTPFHRAVMGGHTDTVKSLLNAEVPADQPTADGRLPMDLAPDKATKEVLKKFSRATAKAEL